MYRVPVPRLSVKGYAWAGEQFLLLSLVNEDKQIPWAPIV